MQRLNRVGAWVLLAAGLAATPVAAQSVMQQCGQQYQAAKAANTLNGMTWPQFRTDCAAKLKAAPASTGAAATPAAPAPAAAAPAVVANPLKPAPTVAVAPAAPAPSPAPAATAAAAEPPTTTAAGKPMSAGRAAFVARERECGSEWKANKATLVVQTPGLTWPKYLSQCNTRLKAAGK